VLIQLDPVEARSSGLQDLLELARRFATDVLQD
jgi:hypothetical protein